MIEVHREFISDEPFPAWTAVGVTELYEPKAIVEISVVAVVPPPVGLADSGRHM